MQSSIKNIDVSEKPFTLLNKGGVSQNRIHFKNFNRNSLSAKGRGTDMTQGSELFGTTLKYTISKSSSYAQRGSSDVEQEVYIPKLLDVSYSTEEIGEGTTISWNTDELNKNGVAVLIEYYAVNQPNMNLAFKNSKSIKRSFVLPDSQGSYTFKSEDLNIFPRGAVLSTNIVRAGYKMEDGGMAVVGFTNVNKDLKMMDN
jgi:hypothetical protein